MQKELDTRQSQLKLRDSVADFIQRSRAVLDTLRFSDMDVRHSNISYSHEQTFDWIFCSKDLPHDDPRWSIEFVDWLRNHNGIYWVTGKPGSGKSTLMKYLVTNPQTTSHLQHWASDRRLLVAKFFSWNARKDLQKSRMGLLRSLLYEILNQCPDRLHDLCQSRWNSWGCESHSSTLPTPHIKVFDDPWDIREMTELLKSLARTHQMSTKFCFFIDGLDEFDGNIFEIIDWLKEIHESEGIKLCLAGRPWNCFENHFGEDKSLKLYLHDLTRSDIALYVRENLGTRLQRSRRRSEYVNIDQLTQEILDKAQGVFLWVFLAVCSLIRGFENGDSLTLLYKRLDAFPPELHDFFGHILSSVEPIYKDMTAILFEAVLKIPQLDILACSFLLDHDKSIAITLPTKMLKQDELKAREEEAILRVNASCLGLVQVGQIDRRGVDCDSQFAHRQPIEFLHRTVKEFLMNDQVRSSLVIPADFCVYSSVGRALLAKLKIHTWRHSPLKCPDFLRIFECFGKAEELHQFSDSEALAEVIRLATTNVDQFGHRDWAYTSPTRNKILRLAVENRLALFLSHQARIGEIDFKRDGPNLLHWALDGSRVWDSRLFRIIKLVLDHGISPNMRPSPSGTVWSQILSKLRYCSACDADAPWTDPISCVCGTLRNDFVNMCIAYGADVHMRVDSRVLGWGMLLVEGFHAKGASKFVSQQVQHFLERGAKPNDILTLGDRTTVWQKLLEEIAVFGSDAKLGGCEAVAPGQVVRLMLRHGADPFAKVNVGDRTFSVTDVVKRYLPLDQVRSVKEALEQAIVRSHSEDQSLHRPTKASGLKRSFESFSREDGTMLMLSAGKHARVSDTCELQYGSVAHRPYVVAPPQIQTSVEDA